MSQTREPRPQRGIICNYISEAPEDYETGEPTEPFASPYDPAVPRATQAPATNPHHVSSAPKPDPVQRPSFNHALPNSSMQNFPQGYLAHQFTAHRPAVEQVGLIGVPPGLPPIAPGDQRAYTHRQDSPIHPLTSSHPYPPVSACDGYPPYGTNPNFYSLRAPYVPTVEQLLEGMHVPTWDELDAASRQIKEYYALRALVDPHGHRLRTHVPVLPNVPSEEHRIWGGLVPLTSENPQDEGVGDNGWNSADNFSQTNPPAHPYETQPNELPEVSPLCLNESQIQTPITIPDEPLFEGPLGAYAPESDDSDNESIQIQPARDRLTIAEVTRAWDRLDDIMISARARSQAFVYPSKLEFIPARGSDDGPLVNQQAPQNRGFVKYWKFLYRSLEELRHMEPLSDRMVIGIRRAISEVESELDKLEEFAVKRWKSECRAKERRRFWRNVFSSGYDDEEWF